MAALMILLWPSTFDKAGAQPGSSRSGPSGEMKLPLASELSQRGKIREAFWNLFSWPVNGYGAGCSIDDYCGLVALIDVAGGRRSKIAYGRLEIDFDPLI